MVLPLHLNVDEYTALPQVEGLQELLASREAAFCEVRSFEASPPPNRLYRQSLNGEYEAPAWYSSQINYPAIHLFRIPEAILFPAFGVVVDGYGRAFRIPMAEAAYHTPNLSLVPRVRRLDTDQAALDVNNLTSLGPTFVSMPWGATKNYGHFLLDALPAVALFLDLQLNKSHSLVVPPLHAWQATHFSLLSVVPIQAPDAAYHCQEVLYASCMNHFLHNPTPIYRSVRQRQLKGLNFSEFTDRPVGKRLYLKRGNDSNARYLTNEYALLRVLEKRGYVAVDPASMPVTAQIRMFMDAGSIVGSSGAAFANTIYCDEGTMVLEIQPNGMESLWVRKLAFINGCVSASYLCPVLKANATHPESSLQFEIDVDRFEKYLDEVEKLAENPS